MKPSECVECEQTIGLSDLICSSCGTEVEDTICSYCQHSLNPEDEKLGSNNVFGLCKSCWTSAFYEMGPSQEVLDSLLGDLGLTIEELPEDMRDNFESYLEEEEQERLLQAEFEE